MSKNDSQIVLHHYIDSLSNVKFLTMVCFIVIAIVIMLVLLIVLVIVIFMMLKRYKSEPPRLSSQHSTCETLHCANSSNMSKHQSKDRVSHTSGLNHAGDLGASGLNMDPKGQNIQMSVLKSRLDERMENSSESSTGISEYLLTTPQEGDVIYESPPKLLAFAGRVFASTRQDPRIPSTESVVHRSAIRPHSRRQSTNPDFRSSLEWDYFESRHTGASNASSESIDRHTVNICWV